MNKMCSIENYTLYANNSNEFPSNFECYNG